MSARRTGPDGRARWLTRLALGAVVALTLAGFWSIAVARRGVVDHAASVFRLETAARARTIESHLSTARAELAFLAGSAALSDLRQGLSSPDPREARWHRMGAEGALLLFLRGRSEVDHILVRAGDGPALVAAGRRGGVPVLWRPPGAGGSPLLPAARAGTSVELSADTGSGGIRLEAALDPARLLAASAVPAASPVYCSIHDATGAPLSAVHDRPELDAAQTPSDWLRSESEVSAGDWRAPGPWRLVCAQPLSPAIALLEPLVARYRLTLALNLAVILIAGLLAWFAIQEAGRRERLEWRAREEARVREVERQLFHTERLSTVGRLAAGMAHEINNPLEGMSNYLALATGAIEKGEATAARRHLEGVRRGLERAAGIVRQVLAHADPSSAPRLPMDVRETLQQAVDFVTSRREFGSIAFITDAPRDPVRVSGNPVLLGQVFLNLLINACEAQPEGGEVGIAMRRESDDLIIEIADRGPGIPSADATRIFEPFYSTKGSTGLGLSVCHAIARQHEGELSVHNRPGGGAVFRLRLPALTTKEARIA